MKRLPMGLFMRPSGPFWLSGLKGVGAVLRLVILAQSTNPEITETDGIVVILEFDEHFRRVRLDIGCQSFVFNSTHTVCGAEELAPMMQHHAIVNHGHVALLHQLLLVVPPRWLKNDVVVLPFTGWPAGVHKRWSLTIDRTSLSVGIGGVVVGIKHLHFVHPVDQHTTVAATLAVALDLRGRGEFQVELKV